MAEIIKETINTERNTPNLVTVDPSVVTQTVGTPVEVEATNTQTVNYIVYFLFGAIEILLTFRFVLKLLGASTISDFVRFIYNVSGIFIAPFEGIFRSGVSSGIETASVFEPATLIAMLVFAVIAWGIMQFVKMMSGKQQVA